MLNPLNFISKFIKSGNQKELDRINKIVKQINFLEENVKKLKDEDFPEETKTLKKKIKDGLSLNQILPEAFALNQNYPNPFNPSTQIRYALPEQSQVVLTVYDMLGRKVRTLVNGAQDAGYRTVMWNATSDLGTPVSAGMYIYTIRANEFYEVKKMILLK